VTHEQRVAKARVLIEAMAERVLLADLAKLAEEHALAPEDMGAVEEAGRRRMATWIEQQMGEVDRWLREPAAPSHRVQ
jgi:hypothetical protein